MSFSNVLLRKHIKLMMLCLLVVFGFGECDFKKSTGPNSFVMSLAKPTRSFAKLLPKSLGFENVTTVPPKDWSSIDANKGYLGSLLGFCVLFLALFVVLFIWFSCWQCFACCCGPVRAERPSVVLIVFHVIGSVFLILSGIFFLVASGSMVSGVNEAGKAPSNLVEKLTFVSDTVNNTVYAAVGNIYPSIASVGTTLKDLVTFLSGRVASTSSVAQNVESEMDKYNQDVKGECVSKLQANTQQQVKTYFDETTNTVKQVAKKLVVGVGDIDNTVKKTKETIDVNLNNAVKAVDGIRDSLSGLLEPVNEIKSNVAEVSVSVEGYIDVAKKYVGPIGFIASLVILSVAIVYFVLFFFPCCCTRCAYGWFSCFGILFDILILLPAAVLALAFVFLNDNCKDIEYTLLGMAGEIISGLTTEDFVNMLLCTVEQPLYDMGFRSVFDYEGDVLDPLLTQLTEKMDGALNIDNLNLDSFKNFSGGIKWDSYVNSANIVGYDHVKYEAGDNPAEFKQCVKGKDDQVDELRNNMITVASFGDAVYPGVANASHQIQNIVTVFLNQTRSTINAGVDSITCMTLKCVYSPVKNAVCVHVQDGIAWWILSSICMIIGLVIMTFVVFFRRKGLLSPTVEAVETEDEDELDMERFASGKL